MEQSIYDVGVVNKPILDKLKVDVARLKEIGYNVQRRELWHCVIVTDATGETVLEVVILPDMVLAWNGKGEELTSPNKIHVTEENGLPVAKTSSELIEAVARKIAIAV